MDMKYDKYVVNVLHRVTKEKLRLYFIDLRPRANNRDIFNINRDIFNIKHINHVKVTIEALYKKNRYCSVKDTNVLETRKINASDLSVALNVEMITQQ